MTLRRHLHHKTPGWVKDGALFHLRIRVAKDQATPLIDNSLSSALLHAVSNYHVRGIWWCELILLMPDHLHMLVSVPHVPGMATTVRNWKRATARIHCVKWQSNYFDHRIRSDEEGNESWRYIRRNPVVRELCQTEDDWPHWWSGVIARD